LTDNDDDTAGNRICQHHRIRRKTGGFAAHFVALAAGDVPILGLSDIVIFPGAVVPLLVETGPSLKLIDDIVAGDRLFGAVLQRKPDVAEPHRRICTKSAAFRACPRW
jgi:ATP-dependent Lon protease